MLDKLNGKKTYFVVGATVITCGVMHYLGVDEKTIVYTFLGGITGSFGTIRHALAKLAEDRYGKEAGEIVRSLDIESDDEA
ncbi:MAG: hypothetical protein MJH10_10835 [Epibacterium sp.]|nr:hypothetical protein [Epibacterium sp.]